MWRRLDEPSLEHCRFQQFSQGYLLAGTVLTMLERQPGEVHYFVFCNPDWTTREAHVTVIHGASTRHVHLRRDERNQWWRDDARLPGLDDLADVDLAITPSTNTLPIRRMALAIGESMSSAAAWVRFPELTVEQLPQTYTRLDERRYRYESRHGAFTAELEVDDVGAVVRYGDIWERLEP